MGVTLYCLAFGCIPFEKSGMLDLYDSIKNDEVKIPDHCNRELRDLLEKLLEKDPSRRIEMDEIRVHPWVTADGVDKLLPKEENVLNLIELPTDDEVRRAITAPILRMVNVVSSTWPSGDV
jgi:[calcium/calmodulin-dependent protein kinase] kinase